MVFNLTEVKTQKSRHHLACKSPQPWLLLEHSVENIQNSPTFTLYDDGQYSEYKYQRPNSFTYGHFPKLDK